MTPLATLLAERLQDATHPRNMGGETRAIVNQLAKVVEAYEMECQNHRWQMAPYSKYLYQCDRCKQKTTVGLEPECYDGPCESEALASLRKLVGEGAK